MTTWESTLGGSRIYFGIGALERLGTICRELDPRRWLLVTDAGLRAAGHVERAERSLRDAGLSAEVFDDVDPNPTTAHVERGTMRARAAGIDGIVGLGGGSAMDTAKGINFLLTNGGRMEDYHGWGKASRPMLPSLGVPATAGTGSEAQSYALISKETDHVKLACGDEKAAFRAVILDPAVAMTAPRSVVATAGIDALAHAVESHVSTRGNPLSRILSREAWRLVEGGLEAVLSGSADASVWGRILFGSHLAGAAIERSMLGAAHALANPLTARFGVPHGAAVGLMLPHVIRYNAKEVGPLYEDLLRSGDGQARASSIESRVRELAIVAGLPRSLADCGVPRDALEDLAAAAESQWTSGFNPRPVRRKELLELYEAAC